MSDRPYTLLSCAVSLDGCLDDASDTRLLLSNDQDFARVDAVRAGCDAILVGAGTVRRDDPRLLVRAAALRAARVARGLPPSPLKVAVLGAGDLDPTAAFFTAGGADKVVYCAGARHATVTAALGAAARVVAAGDPLDLAHVVADLAARGVRRLLVEGGATVLTGFLTAGLADELHLVVAPFFVGDPRAPRFGGAGRFPVDAAHRAHLLGTEAVGDCVLLRYALSARALPPAAAG